MCIRDSVFTDTTDGNTKLRGFLRDNDYSFINTELIFIQDENNTILARVENLETLEAELNGITISLESTTGTFQSVMMSMVGTATKLKVTGRGGTFLVRYRYDPNYSLVDKTMSDNDVTPVNTTVLPESFSLISLMVFSITRPETKHSSTIIQFD